MEVGGHYTAFFCLCLLRTSALVRVEHFVCLCGMQPAGRLGLTPDAIWLDEKHSTYRSLRMAALTGQLWVSRHCLCVDLSSDVRQRHARNVSITSLAFITDQFKCSIFNGCITLKSGRVRHHSHAVFTAIYADFNG